MAAAPDIFLSYNREDQAVAGRFVEAFEREGLSVWWDQTLRSGEAYDQVTEQALVFNPRFNFALKDRAGISKRWGVAPRRGMPFGVCAPSRRA
jgi:hypothetical protein